MAFFNYTLFLMQSFGFFFMPRTVIINEVEYRIDINKTRTSSLEQMTDDVKNFISKNYGSVDAWLTAMIESTINLIKNKK